MKVIIASDHAGFTLKELVKKELAKNNYEVIDLGTTNLSSVDYPDYAFELGKLVLEDERNFGILICGTGIGMSIACNKIKGIRCAKVSNEEEALLSRAHNDANVIALSSKNSLEEAAKWIQVFLQTPFSNEERHIRRIKKIKDYEDNYEH